MQSIGSSVIRPVLLQVHTLEQCGMGSSVQPYSVFSAKFPHGPRGSWPTTRMDFLSSECNEVLLWYCGYKSHRERGLITSNDFTVNQYDAFKRISIYYH